MGKRILMIAGPNGAGKTTMAQRLIINSTLLYEFINADEIAKSLAPIHPESMALTASKLMIKRLKELLDANKNFAFETTAAGTNYLKHLKFAKSRGYEIVLAFLWLSSPEHAISRVAQRVKQGGHNVPEKTIIKRYHLGIKNLLKHYLPIVDRALIMNNSSDDFVGKIIAGKNRDHLVDVIDKDVWEDLVKGAYER
jgi:predicted ABC-type ATPase